MYPVIQPISSIGFILVHIWHAMAAKQHYTNSYMHDNNFLPASSLYTPLNGILYLIQQPNVPTHPNQDALVTIIVSHKIWNIISEVLTTMGTMGRVFLTFKIRFFKSCHSSTFVLGA